MIYLAIIYGILFFVFGYLVKILLNYKYNKLEEDFYYEFKKFKFLPDNLHRDFNKKPNLFLLQNKAILINPNINAALQEIFDIILLNYINSWYLGFSNNEDFVVEVKYFFHIICSQVLLRVKQIDIPRIITDKFMPAIINHLDICYTIQHSDENGSTAGQMQELILQKMRSHLHVAMIGRGEELAYLKSISKFLLPRLTPDYFSHTNNKISFHLLQEIFTGIVLLPAMDSLATPDVINKFICLLLEPSQTSTIIPSTKSSEFVPILHRYQTAWIEKLKIQKCHPKVFESFLRDDKYLYYFLQYVKSINAIAPINFFMLMDSITLKLHNPEIGETIKIQLLEDLQRLEDLMQSADEYSDLNISPNLHNRVKEIISNGHNNVLQLTNCEIWMENYHSICRHTVSLYLAQYFESEFYLSTIYGERQSDIDSSYECEWENINVIGDCLNVVPSQNLYQGSTSQLDTDTPKISSFKKMSLDLFNFDFMADSKSPISEELKSAFSTPDKHTAPSFPFFQSIFQKEKELSNIEKQKDFSMTKFGYSIRNVLSFNSDDSVDSISGDVEIDNTDISYLEKNYSFEEMIDLPDLSNLRVKIPSISQPFILGKPKNEFCFSVHTYRVDSDDLLYKVHRKYGEFYVLEQKLNEFHGDIGRTLPPKKPWDNKKLDFLDNCKFPFETYLLFLVTRPMLRNSSLLSKFLTSESEFNINSLIDINLGKFVKAMPMKLLKEKGQFLEHFMYNFHASCESSGNAKANSASDSNSLITSLPSDQQIQSMIDRRMHSRLFWNNAEFINVKYENFMNDICTFSTHYIFYFYDAICYFYETITKKLSYCHLLLTVFYLIRTVLVNILQIHVVNIIEKGIEKLCIEKVAIEIIHTLRDVTLLAGFTRTNTEKSECRNKALKCLHYILPQWLMGSLSTNYKMKIYTNIERIFDCLQQPKLNKQLSYVLLDILLIELFPELSENFAHNNEETITEK